MSDIRKCPGCNTMITGKEDTCPQCGMIGLNRIFLSKEEHDEWVRNELKPSVSKQDKEADGDPLYDEYIDWYNRKMRMQNEREKERLSYQVERAKENCEYSQAAKLMNEIAAICHDQNLEHDAYWLEHDAFLCTQKAVYKAADISLDEFNGNLPFVENLKVAMTKAAEEALEKGRIDRYVAYKLANARICRAQGQERNAYLLENSAYPYKEKAEKLMRKKGMSYKGFEKQCLKRIAEEYRYELYR